MWLAQCDTCFLASLIAQAVRNELTTQTVSTISGSSVRAITSADAGNITCEVRFSGDVHSSASLNITLTGKWSSFGATVKLHLHLFCL